jgi:hypothetical protein
LTIKGEFDMEKNLQNHDNPYVQTGGRPLSHADKDDANHKSTIEMNE